MFKLLIFYRFILLHEITLSSVLTPKRLVSFPHVIYWAVFFSLQFSSVAQSCPTLCDPMNRSTPGLPVHHQLQEFTQTHVHRVGDAIQPSHPLSSPSPPAPNPSQHQGLFQWVNSSHEVTKVPWPFKNPLAITINACISLSYQHTFFKRESFKPL